MVDMVDMVDMVGVVGVVGVVGGPHATLLSSAPRTRLLSPKSAAFFGRHPRCRM